MKLTLQSSLFLSTLALLSGCGSNVEDLSLHTGPITGAPNKGVFINRVDGLEYTRTFVPVAQLTTKDSTYEYRTGEPIMFHIGNLEIGEGLGLDIITPKEIVSYKNLELNTSINSNEVNNRVRVLMSLDEDSDPSNGIKISPATRELAKKWSTPDYNLAESAFKNELKSSTGNYFDNKPITTKQAAKKQFAKELRCVYSGAYSGQWLLPNGDKSGFVGVMIQSSNTVDANSSLGTIVTLGDGQDLNGDGIAKEYLFARGTHNMDTGSYMFNETGEFKNGGIIPSDQNVSGDGKSISYDKVEGSFKQIIDGKPQYGSYEAVRVGQGQDSAYRYTGFGYGNSTNNKNPATDPILGLFTFDVDRNGTVVGLIHDARNNQEPAINGKVDFNVSTNNIVMNLTYPKNGGTFLIKGTLAFDGTVNLNWFDENGTIKYGYIAGVGCQLQPHN